MSYAVRRVSFMGIIIGLVLASGVMSVCMWPLKYFEDDIRAAVVGIPETRRKLLMGLACTLVFGPAFLVFLWCAFTI